MSTSVEYKSTDSSAPTLQVNVAYSFISLLKSVLVNGYGDKTPLGWDIMYEDASNHVCVFRPRVGSRMFLQVIDNNTTKVGTAYIYTWESMFDAFNGIHKMPTDTKGAIIEKGYSTNVSAVSEWSVIGDEYGFYLLLRPNGTGAEIINKRMSLHYFGEGIVIGDTSFTTSYNWLHVAQDNAYKRPMFLFMRNPTSQVAGYLNTDSIFSASFSGWDYAGRRTNSSIAGVQGYEPVYLRFYEYNTYEINLPGIFAPILPAPVHQYRFGEDWYEEIDKNNKLYCFPGIHPRYTIVSEEFKYAILIGDRFRHVF